MSRFKDIIIDIEEMYVNHPQMTVDEIAKITGVDAGFVYDVICSIDPDFLEEVE